MIMKRTKLTLTISALGLIVMSSCRKDNIVATSATANERAAAQTGLVSGERIVYTMDNAVSGNKVMVFKRATNGTLSASAVFPTGGTGTGAGLGSQGAIAADNNRHLFVCNAGSNNITVFQINGLMLTKLDRISSHGTTPISLTVHDNLLYVLNAGGAGNISGYTIDDNGHLTHLSKSNAKLSSDTSGPAQIEFNHAGTQLVVTEKATSLIVTYDIDANGVAGKSVIHPSVGQTPFGFEFGKNNQLIVSDAFGGAANESAMSSYKLSNNGNLSLITGPVATHQTAACWVSVTKI